MESLLVVCLCATWCNTCTEFQRTFDELARLRPDARFAWLDLDDDSDLAGDADVENFPTLAVFRGDAPLFYGVTMPQPGVVERTLAYLERPDAAAIAVPADIAGLPQALRVRPERGRPGPRHG